MSDELIQPEKKVGIGAYISLIFACVFFSGAFASNHWWGIFDFITLNGTWGKVVQTAVMNDAGTLQTVLGNFRGKGGSGAIDGFCFALTLIPSVGVLEPMDVLAKSSYMQAVGTVVAVFLKM